MPGKYQKGPGSVLKESTQCVHGQILVFTAQVSSRFIPPPEVFLLSESILLSVLTLSALRPPAFHPSTSSTVLAWRTYLRPGLVSIYHTALALASDSDAEESRVYYPEMRKIRGLQPHHSTTASIGHTAEDLVTVVASP